MNRVIITQCLTATLVGAALALSPVSSLLAQDAAGPILTLYEVKVKHGHESKWREALQAWNKCYGDNGGKGSWDVWKRMQGEGNLFTFTGMSDNWAEVGTRDPATRECADVFETQLTPHEDSEVTMMAQLMPDISSEYMDGTTVVGVYSFTVDDSRTFNTVITEVSKAMMKTDGTIPLQWYEVIGGGEDDADYFVVTDHADFASMDKDWTGPWEAVEQQHGKETAEEWRAMFADAVDEQWDYMHVLEKDLGFEPAAE